MCSVRSGPNNNVRPGVLVMNSYLSSYTMRYFTEHVQTRCNIHYHQEKYWMYVPVAFCRSSVFSHRLITLCSMCVWRTCVRSVCCVAYVRVDDVNPHATICARMCVCVVISACPACHRQSFFIFDNIITTNQRIFPWTKCDTPILFCRTFYLCVIVFPYVSVRRASCIVLLLVNVIR